MNRSFTIRDKIIGDGAPCYVIAEAGSNHNGSLETALALIEVAAQAGADAVKFQTFKAKRLYTRTAGTSDYLGDRRSIYDIIEAMEMPEGWLPQLSQRAHELGLAFISTPFHEEAVALLHPHVDAFKVASYELTHLPLLREVGRSGLPVIVSTGAGRMDEVRAAVAALKEAGAAALVLLQCTAAYPAPLESINVRAIPTLYREFEVPVGLSDHSRDPVVAPVAAVALGASVIEKHFTLSNHLPGPDHPFAVEPVELARLVKRVRDVERALGSGDKEVHAVEQELRAFARRSLFTTAAVRQGEVFTRDNVDVLRRGKREAGLEPSHLERVLGSTAARDLAADQPLQTADVRFREP